MNRELIGEILTHVSAFFLGASTALICWGRYINRQTHRYNECCNVPAKDK